MAAYHQQAAQTASPETRPQEILTSGNIPVNRESLRQLMQAVQSGEVLPEDACNRLKDLPFEDLGYAKVDHHRLSCTGMPEVIYSAGKTSAQVAGIFTSNGRHRR